MRKGGREEKVEKEEDEEGDGRRRWFKGQIMRRSRM